jgi:hypothetical protein
MDTNVNMEQQIELKIKTMMDILNKVEMPGEMTEFMKSLSKQYVLVLVVTNIINDYIKANTNTNTNTNTYTIPLIDEAALKIYLNMATQELKKIYGRKVIKDCLQKNFNDSVFSIYTKVFIIYLNKVYGSTKNYKLNVLDIILAKLVTKLVTPDEITDKFKNGIYDESKLALETQQKEDQEEEIKEGSIFNDIPSNKKPPLDPNNYSYIKDITKEREIEGKIEGKIEGDIEGKKKGGKSKKKASRRRKKKATKKRKSRRRK